MKLVDFVPQEHLPLRSNGNVYDEIQGNVLYKRIDADGNVLDIEEKILLNSPFSIFECAENVELEMAVPYNLYPDMEIKYPVAMSDYINHIVNK